MLMSMQEGRASPSGREKNGEFDKMLLCMRYQVKSPALGLGCLSLHVRVAEHASWTCNVLGDTHRVHWVALIDMSKIVHVYRSRGRPCR